MMFRLAAAVAATFWLIGGTDFARAQPYPPGGGTPSITAGPTWTNGIGNRSATVSVTWANNAGFSASGIYIEVYWVVINNGVRTETLDGLIGQNGITAGPPWNNIKVNFNRAGLHCVKVRLRSTKMQQPNMGMICDDLVQSTDQLIQ